MSYLSTSLSWPPRVSSSRSMLRSLRVLSASCWENPLALSLSSTLYSLLLQVETWTWPLTLSTFRYRLWAVAAPLKDLVSSAV